MSASSIWSFSEADFPAQGSSRQRMGFALKYAALAPLDVAEQPWEFRLADSYLELSARLEAMTTVVDPDGREAFIGCGAGLHHLKLTLRHFGCLGRLEYFPDLAAPALVARVHLGNSRERDLVDTRLFAALNQPPNLGTSAGGSPVSEIVLAEISRAVSRERGWLEFAQSDASRRRLVELAAKIDLTTSPIRPDRDLQSRKLNFGTTSGWSQSKIVGGGPDFAERRTQTETVREGQLLPACLAVVKTKTDDKHGWVAAGQTMARAALQAQVLGLSWACFSKVARRSAREALRTEIGHKGFAQLILRFGGLLAQDGVRLERPTTATATSR